MLLLFLVLFQQSIYISFNPPVGCIFNKTNGKALRHGFQVFGQSFPAKAKHGHLLVHLVKGIGMIIVLMMG